MVKTEFQMPKAVHAFPNKREKTFKKFDKPDKSERVMKKKSYLHVDTKEIQNK
jgi:hypothetical protein